MATSQIYGGRVWSNCLCTPDCSCEHCRCNLKDTDSVENQEVVEFNVKGMSCASCVSSIENILLSQDGIKKAFVHLIAQRARIEFDHSLIDAQEIHKAIEDLGFKAEYIEPSYVAVIFFLFFVFCFLFFVF